MKKDKRVYFITTGIIFLVMIFSIYKMFTPDYDKLGLPSYIRAELCVLKIIGLIVLITPQFSTRMKEWAYAGFGITLISAFVAHANSGDPLLRSLEPIIFLAVLIISNIYWHKISKTQTQNLQSEI
jgi:hypothetical protein